MTYNILIVDDDPNILMACSQTLKMEGHNITEASGVDMAIPLHKPDVTDMVLSDVQMPEKTGFELLKEVRKKDTNCLFIMMTANPNSSDMVKATKEWGANGYLIKPFDSEQLRKVIKQYFRLYEIKKNLRSSFKKPPSP